MPKWNGTEFEFPTELPYTSDLRVWVFNEDVQQTITSLGSYCNSVNADCGNLTLESLEESTASINISGSGFTIDNYTYNPDDRVYINYKPDIATLNIPSLAGIIRNIVCCTVGSNLYSKEDTEWKHITRFCEKATEQLATLDEYYLPPEFRKYKWFKRPVPVKGGITSIKIGRA
jgi:hypothetical protein